MREGGSERYGRIGHMETGNNLWLPEEGRERASERYGRIGHMETGNNLWLPVYLFWMGSFVK